MKKILSILLAIVMIFGVLALTACGEEEEAIKIAVVTDVGQLNDGGFNQGSYEGAKAYAEAHGIKYSYYQPANGSNATDADRIEAMNNAVANGAEVIVTPGFLQEAAIREVGTAHPEVKFIFIDGWDMGMDNVVGISYAEQESGYFAGYAAVKDGYTDLAGVFGGGSAGGNPACSRFAYGYVLGAKAAAKELGKEVKAHISFKFGASFSASSDLQAQALGLYGAGTEVIFSCGGSMVNSVIAAADENGSGKVIGVDVDQASMSERVITSAVKGLNPSVQWALDKLYSGKWDELGGSATLGASDDATGIPTGSSWRFTNYTEAEYQQLFAKVKAGTLKIEAPAAFTLSTYTDLTEAGVITVTAEE